MQRSSLYGKASPSGLMSQFLHLMGQEMGRGAVKIVKSQNRVMSAVKQAFPEVAKSPRQKTETLINY